VAELLRIDEETVEQMADAGELPGRRLGDAWRFNRAAVLRWLGDPDEED
jgi:excisionase family DNA binding protein